MNKDELSLLLYLEARLVDGSGLIDPRNMNSDDFKIAERWNREGFIKFGRLKMREIEALPQGRPPLTHYVRFTLRAWEAAHRERRARAERIVKRWEETYFVPEGLRVPEEYEKKTRKA